MGLSCSSGLWHQFPVNPVHSRVEKWLDPWGDGRGCWGCLCSLEPGPLWGTAHGCQLGLPEAADLFFLGIFLLFCSLLRE